MNGILAYSRKLQVEEVKNALKRFNKSKVLVQMVFC